MSSERSYTFKLDSSLAVKLRDKINEYPNISLHKTTNSKQNTVWLMICAIMDRIDDETYYLNTMTFCKESRFKRTAFDFMDFLNHSSVLVDCITKMAGIYNVSLVDLKTSNSIFDDKGINGKGTDKNYFEYLRSLCSIHPVDTNRHEEYHGVDTIACCPFVQWQTGICDYGNGDLTATVYYTKDDAKDVTTCDIKQIPINLDEVFEYVRKRFSFIEEIITGIEVYNKQVISDYKCKKIETPEAFESYPCYLNNLVNEYKKRQGDDMVEDFTYVEQLDEFIISDARNKNKFDKYLQAIKYAITFFHTGLQDMNFDSYEGSGLKYKKPGRGETLFDLIMIGEGVHCNIDGWTYSQGKIYDLLHSEYDSLECAMNEFKNMLPFIRQYVHVSNKEKPLEKYVLWCLACYFNALENACVLNVNIPNLLDYRAVLLDDKRLQEMQSEIVQQA